MATGGLLQWANGIRLTMATDPGRALFKEQVQMHGFSFLDDYLDNILLNVKQDALIELVKTPGRKRTLTKKPKPASKLKQGVTLFSEDEEPCQTAQQEVAMGTQPELAAHPTQVKTSNTVPAQVSYDDVSTMSEVTTSTLIDSLPHGKINELSTIAEDDEIAERSRVSLPLDPTVVQLSQEVQESGVSVNPPANVILSLCIAESATKVVEPQISPVALHDSNPAPPKVNSPPIPPPTLVPLRKSMTTSTENPTGMGAATPGGPVPGKRTSWLQKARQAKALEIAGRKATSSLSSSSLLQPTSTTLLPSNMKRKSTDGFSGPSEDDDERHHKVAKTTMVDTAPTNSNLNVAADGGSSHLQPVRTTSPPPLEAQRPETRELGEGDMLNLLKKTVKGLGSRTGKGTGKSLGGPAATALAEARAAAEARIAERNMKEEQTMNMAHYNALSLNRTEEHGELASLPEPQPLSAGQDSGSLNPSSELNLAEPIFITSKVPSMPIFNIEPAAGESESRTTTTTTPPNPPPLSIDVFRPPPGPVFNKPAPVFVPPKHVKQVARDQMEKDNQPSSSKDSLAPKSTLESTLSDTVFSYKERSTPVRTSSTQDTLHSNLENTNVCDEDDSWPIDEKLEEGVQWVYGNAKDDNTTWSSLPSHQNTGNLSEDMLESGHGRDSQDPPTSIYTGGNFADVYDTDAIQKNEIQNVISDGEQDEAPQHVTMSTISLIESKAHSQSQISNSTSSQQSNVGFFGQATKLISNMIGSSKNAKPEVKKVLQKAAVAAKKQQEESDKKTARLKEMETRRQQAMQRKAEEEKARVIEQEKKLKEENERRKREREELTDKRLLKATGGRKEDDTLKKRKIDVEKKPDIKRSAVNPPKSSVKLAIKQPSALSSSTVYNSSFNTNGAPAAGSKPGETGIPKPGTTAQGLPKGKGKMTVKAAEDDLPQPSQIVRTQMAARAKAQLRAADQANEPSAIPSESIELPDINSEYSDSEDEDRQRTFDPPDWAQSPELMHALQQQSTINPDDIFGAIRPLRMEEIFKTRTSRFRARTSSANWVGADRLTAEEEREYARRMGFK